MLRTLVAIPIRIRRPAQDARHIANEVDAQIHLEEGEACVHPFFELPGKPFHSRHGRRVHVQTDAVAVLAAEQLVDGNAVRLARQVPQGHFDAGDAAALSSVVAELSDLLEQSFDVARVFAEQSALEHQRVSLAAAVANLAIAGNPLIRIDADQGHAKRRPTDDGHAEIGDPQPRRPRGPPDVLRSKCHLLFDRPAKSAAQAQAAQPETFEKATPRVG